MLKGICISQPPAPSLAPDPDSGPGPWPPALAPNLYLPALASNLYLLAPNPNVCYPTLAKNNSFTGPGP